jgi:hypothetical protein
MKLQNLIHKMRNENSYLGEVTREIESDSNYFSYQNEQRLKEYLRDRMKQKGMLSEFAELLSIHELINQQAVEGSGDLIH